MTSPRSHPHLPWVVAASVALLASTLGFSSLASATPATLTSCADHTTTSTSWVAPHDGLWSDPGNWTNGVPNGSSDPSVGCDAIITVAGTYTVYVSGHQGTRFLTFGGTSGTQTLEVVAGGYDIYGNPAELKTTTDAYLTLDSGATIGQHGVIHMTGVANPAPPAVAGGVANVSTANRAGQTITLSGTLQADGSGGGPRQLQVADFSNQGTVAITSGHTTYFGGLDRGFHNRSAFTVANGALFDSYANYTQFINEAGGHITNNGTFHASGGVVPSFVQGDGTTTGNPVLSDGVQYTGVGASIIQTLGDVHGDMAAGQTLLIKAGEPNNDALISYWLPARVAGTIRLFSHGGGGVAQLNGHLTTLTDALTITPTGHLMVDPDDSGGANGGRQLYILNIVNKGTVDINTNVTQWGGGANPNQGFHNQGTLQVAPEATLHQNADNNLFNEATGTIVNHGLISNERDSTNAGTFTLASSDAAHPAVFWAGTFTNTGTVIDDPSGGGLRTINSSQVVNQGTLKLRATTGSALTVNGNFTQGPAGTLRTAVASNTSFGRLAATGAVTLDGTIRADASPAPTAGRAFGVLTGASRAGTFSTEVWNGTTFTPRYLPAGVTLLTGQAKPDGRIRLGTSGSFVGNNVYNTTGTGQTRSGSAARGHTVTYDVSVQNDAPFADALRLKGTASNANFTVSYQVGATDVTAQVVAGTYTTPSLAPGATQKVRVVVTVGAAAPSGSSLSATVLAKSDTDTARRDTVRFVTSRA